MKQHNLAIARHLIVIPLILLILPITLAQTLKDSDFVYYHDERYPFSAWYPKTWSKVPITHPQTRLKVRNENEIDDYSINIISLEELKKLSPKEYIGMLSKNDYLNLLRTTFPDITLLESGQTFVSNQEALYFITKLTQRSVGIELPMAQMQILTAKDGNVYTLTLRTEPERLEEMLPVFRAILMGFVIRPQLSPERTTLKPSTGTASNLSANKGVKFQPTGSEFYVLFPKNPTVKTLDTSTQTGERIRSLSAELVIEQERCFLRAEFVPKPSGSLDTMGDEALMNAILQYAEYNGLEFPEATVGANYLGKYAKVRGFKTIEGIKCTYEAITYYGQRSIMMLYAGGPSKQYPQHSVSRFFDSIGK